jgi:hypothetical protein
MNSNVCTQLLELHPTQSFREDVSQLLSCVDEIHLDQPAPGTFSNVMELASQPDSDRTLPMYSASHYHFLFG